MADFLLTVGIDVGASFSEMQADISKLVSQLNANPIKIKAELDKASVTNMRNQLEAAIKLTGGTNTNASGIASDMNNIANSANRAADATNRLNASASKANTLTTSTTQYYTALRQVDNALKQVTVNQQKWTAAKTGKTSGAYNDLGKYANALEDLKGRLMSGTMSAEEFRNAMASISAGVSQATNTIQVAGKATLSWGDRIKGLGAKFANWFGTTQIIMAGVRAVKDMVNNVTEIDSAMVDLRKVTDETDEAYTSFLDRATKKSKEMGVSIKDNVKATTEFARLGYDINQSEVLAEAAVVYKNVGDIENIETASESIISTMQAFGVLPENVMSIVDKFNEVGNNYAISSNGLGEALVRSAAAMKAAGNTLDETIALTTAANTVAQDPMKVGTTLKTVSMYLRAAKTEAEDAGESTDGMATSVSKLRSELLSLTGGKVDIQLDENTFKSTYQILKELSEVWDSLTDISKANILEKVGGKRNANIVSAILENFDIAEDALKTSQESAGSAMTEYDKWLDSVEAKKLQLKASWEALSLSFLSSDFLKFAVDGLKGLVDGLNAVVSAIGSLGTIAAGTGLWALKKYISAKGIGGLVSALSAIPFPAAAAVAALTAVGVAIYKNKQYSDKLKIGATLSEDADNIKEHADNIVELNNLMSEVDDLELVINTPSSTQEQIDSAKARLEEIAALVNNKYELNISSNPDEIKDTLRLLSHQQRGEMMDDVDNYVDKLNKTEYTSAKSNYAADKKRYDDLSEIYSNLDNLNRKRNTIVSSPHSNERTSDLYKIDSEIEAYYKEIEKMGYGDLVRDASFKQFGLDLIDVGEELKNSETKFNNTSLAITNFEESAKKATDYLSQVLASDVSIGDTYGVDTSVAKFEQLGKTLAEAGASTDYVAQKFAITRQGVMDLQSAIDAGKLESVVDEYIGFKKAIGETSENAVRGAALLKQGFTEAAQVTGESIHAVYDSMKQLGESNGVADAAKNAVEGTAIYAAGFNNLQDVIAAGDDGINKFLSSAKDLYEYGGLFPEDMGIEQKSEELTKFAQQIGLIPENKAVRIDVTTGEVSVITDVTKKINDIWGGGDKTLVVNVGTEVDESDVDDYAEKLAALDGQDCNVKFEVNGEAAKATIGDVVYELEDYDESTGTATLYAEDGNAIATFNLVTGQIDLIPNKKIIKLEVSDNGEIEGIKEYAGVIDDLKGRGNISFKIDVDGNAEVLNEAGEVISRLEKDKNIVFSVDDNGSLQVINALDSSIQVLDQYGNVQVNIQAAVQNLGVVEGLKGDLEYLNGQQCLVVVDANNRPAAARIGETVFAIKDYDAMTGTATIVAENGEAIAIINTTTNEILAIPDKDVDVTVDVTGEEKVRSLSDWLSGLKDKVVKVFTQIFGPGEVDGTAQVDGTAHASGTAFSNGKNGNWGTKGSGVALGGELGQELVVRDGRFFTIGDSGAEFFAYKKGDIIFNAEQTRQIFEKGRITHGRRRGRAFAMGTPFSDRYSKDPNGFIEFVTENEIIRTPILSDKNIEASDVKGEYLSGLNENTDKSSENLSDYLDKVKRAYKIHQNEIQCIEELQYALDNLVKTDEERLEVEDLIAETQKAHAHNRIGDIEHEIELVKNLYGENYDVSSYYDDIQNIAHIEAERLRLLGYDNQSEEIQELQKKWWDAENSKLKFHSKQHENTIRDIEHSRDMELESNAFADPTYYYTKMQEEYHREAERLRALDPEKYKKEIQELQKKWWDAQNEIADWRWEDSNNYISQRNKLGDWELFEDSEVEAWERVVRWLKKDYPDELDKIQEAENKLFDARQDLLSNFFDELKDKVDDVYDIRIDRLNSQSSLLSEHFDLVNLINEEQHTLNKELREAEIIGAKMNEQERELLFTRAEHNKLSGKLSDIMLDITDLQNNYMRDLERATEETIEEVTNQYERQYALKMKEYEIVKAELNLIKKQQILENIENEKSVRTWNGSSWVYEANLQDVLDATEEVENAKYELARAKAEEAQQAAINTIDANADALQTEKNKLTSAIEDMAEKMEGSGKDITTMLETIAKTDLPTFDAIIRSLGDGIKTAFDISDEDIQKYRSEGYYLREMKKNSDAWHSADDTTKEALEAQNRAYAEILGLDFEESTGRWKKKNGTYAYASGTKSAKKGLGLFDEDGFGSELILSDDGILTKFNGGEKVFSSEMADRLWKMAQGNYTFGASIIQPDLGKIIPVEDRINNAINNISNAFGDTYMIKDVQLNETEGGTLKGFINFLKKKI